MGVQPVQYGSVFLFRNGFRILPYGNEYDDSWQLDHRAQQGYNRFLGTRDLFGRVDVETDNIENFKENSSREGGLIQSESTEQLFDYFTVTHRRLERYVTGVLWGEAFLRRDYFKDKETAERERTELQDLERDSSSAKHVYESIGSKIDFVQLIKSMVSDKNVTVKYYNKDLADIISGLDNIEDIKPKFIDDLKGIADKTDNKELLQTIEEAQEHIYTLQKEKEETEAKLAEETERREVAEKKAEEEESKRQVVEKEKEAQVQKNRYLSSVRDTSQEVTDAIHTVLISSGAMKSLANTCSYLLKEDHVDVNKLSANIDSIKFHIDRIDKIASMITKADAAMLDEAQNVDLKEYIKEYLSNYDYSKNIQYKDECSDVIMKKIPLLDLSVIMDNLVSNSGKARAEDILVTFRNEGRDLIVDFSDNGEGVDLDKFTPDTIFEEGVTNRRGGSGIGLSTIKEQMNKNLNGDILFAGNGLHSCKGATFRLIFK
ncbi:MAG TPA: ATP-binding protein [Xylanibacter oryzae]|nr:ATP-binding protein [Xylanibacter oryzae]